MSCNEMFSCRRWDLTACRQTLRTWTGCFGLQVRRQVRLQVPCLTLRQPDDSLSALNMVRSKASVQQARTNFVHCTRPCKVLSFQLYLVAVAAL